MKLIIREKDNVVMNDRINNDWRGYDQLQQLYADLIAEEDNSIKEQMKIQVKETEERYQQWGEKRLVAIVRQYGGVESDYELKQVNAEDIINAMTARYITFDGKKFHYDTGPRYSIDNDNPGKMVVYAPQWVKGNEALLEDDITDFREEEFKANMSFSLEFWQMASTKDIVVELFLWGPLEDKGEPPKGKTFCHVICSGTYHHDTKTVEVR